MFIIKIVSFVIIASSTNKSIFSKSTLPFAFFIIQAKGKSIILFLAIARHTELANFKAITWQFTSFQSSTSTIGQVRRSGFQCMRQIFFLDISSIAPKLAQQVSRGGGGISWNGRGNSWTQLRNALGRSRNPVNTINDGIYRKHCNDEIMITPQTPDRGCKKI